MTLPLLFPPLLASLLTLSSPPLASEPVQEDAAHALYTEGKRAFEQGQLPQALEHLERAYQALQNDHIRYYLGRTHAALGRCQAALDYFELLGESLPPAPREARRQAEVTCRLSLANTYLDSYQCHEALETLRPIASSLRLPEARRRFSALQGTAKKCRDVFGTRTSLGQKAAQFYAAARAALRAGHTSKALSLADKSLAAKPSRPAAAVEAIALGKLGRCGLAIDRLETAMVYANAEDAHIMGELSVRCRLSEGKRLLKGGSCYQIIAMLEPLEGKLSATDDLWRRQKINWCRPHARPFSIDTPERQAAYKLFVEAERSAQASDARALTRAAALYKKALRLADEAPIRRPLAHLEGRLSGCDAALQTLSKLAPEAHRASERTLIELCERYPPASSLTELQRAAYLEELSQVLTLRDAGVYLQAISRLSRSTFKAAISAQALYADLLYGAGLCDDYVTHVDALPQAARQRAQEVERRHGECSGQAEPPTKPSLSEVTL